MDRLCPHMEYLEALYTVDGTNIIQNALLSNTSGAVTLKTNISRTMPCSLNWIVSFRS